MSTRHADVATAVTVAGGPREYLVARIAETRVAFPIDRVETVLDGSVGAESPCDEPWVAGWFVHRDRMWLVVRLDGRRRARGANAKRVVVGETDGVRYAVEVDEVHGAAVLDEVGPSAYPVRGWTAPDGWLKRGAAFDGRPVCCIDVDAVARRLGPV